MDWRCPGQRRSAESPAADTDADDSTPESGHPGWQCPYHVGDKAAVARTPALLLIARPHDLHARNVPKAHKLALQHLRRGMG